MYPYPSSAKNLPLLFFLRLRDDTYPFVPAPFVARSARRVEKERAHNRVLPPARRPLTPRVPPRLPRPPPTPQQAPLENARRTMSTTRGIAFFVFASVVLLLLLGTLPCGDAARGVGGAATTSCPVPGAPAPPYAVHHTAGGSLSPIYGTERDEPASNEIKMRHTEASGAAVGGGAGTAMCVLPIAPLPRVPSPVADTDKERQAVVVLGRAGKVESGMSVACPYCGGKGRTAQPGTTGRGGHAFLRVWSAAVLSVVSVAGVGVASVRYAGGSLISHGGACASSHGRRWLRSAMVGLAVMSSGGAGVSAAACTASTCCNVAIPKLDPLTTTTIDQSICSEGT